MTVPPGAYPARSRTFKPRRRRLSPTREAELGRLLPVYGLEIAGPPVNLDATFGRRACRALEIGCGAGEAALAMSEAAPDTDLIACDVHTPGIARLLTEIDRLGLINLRVVHGDALDLAARLPGRTFDEVRIFFPDPWPKPRQRQRRLVRDDLLPTIIDTMTGSAPGRVDSPPMSTITPSRSRRSAQGAGTSRGASCLDRRIVRPPASRRKVWKPAVG